MPMQTLPRLQFHPYHRHDTAIQPGRIGSVLQYYEHDSDSMIYCSKQHVVASRRWLGVTVYVLQSYHVVACGVDCRCRW